MPQNPTISPEELYSLRMAIGMARHFDCNFSDRDKICNTAAAVVDRLASARVAGAEPPVWQRTDWEAMAQEAQDLMVRLRQKPAHLKVPFDFDEAVAAIETRAAEPSKDPASHAPEMEVRPFDRMHLRDLQSQVDGLESHVDRRLRRIGERLDDLEKRQADDRPMKVSAIFATCSKSIDPDRPEARCLKACGHSGECFAV